MTKSWKNLLCTLGCALAISTVSGTPASADWQLLYVQFHDDGTTSELWENEDIGLDVFLGYNSDGTLAVRYISASPTNPTEDDSQAGFTGTNNDVTESIEQLLNGKGGSLELIPEFWDSHVGRHLLGKGAPHAAGYDPSPIDNLADGILNGGNPLDGGGTGGIDPLGGNIVDQLKNKGGSGSGDDDDDGSSKPPAGSVPGGEELPGPAELVNPSPEDLHAFDAAMGAMPDVPMTDMTIGAGADVTQGGVLQTHDVGAVPTADPATTSDAGSATEEPSLLQAADVEMSMH